VSGCLRAASRVYSAVWFIIACQHSDVFAPFKSLLNKCAISILASRKGCMKYIDKSAVLSGFWLEIYLNAIFFFIFSQCVCVPLEIMKIGYPWQRGLCECINFRRCVQFFKCHFSSKFDRVSDRGSFVTSGVLNIA